MKYFYCQSFMTVMELQDFFEKEIRKNQSILYDTLQKALPNNTATTATKINILFDYLYIDGKSLNLSK